MIETKNSARLNFFTKTKFLVSVINEWLSVRF